MEKLEQNRMPTEAIAGSKPLTETAERTSWVSGVEEVRCVLAVVVAGS